MRATTAFISFLAIGAGALAAPVAMHAATTLPVPFTSQAPFSDWHEPWQNACEEATIVMVDSFYKQKTLEPEGARQALLDIFRIKNNTFGWSLDEDADTIAELINAYLPWEASVAVSPTVEQIKQEIDAGRPVIIPAYGKALYNPHFKNGGPIYHTVVISGYDDAARMFITQEPGTRHGLDFRYSYDRIMNAMHDFVPGNTANGRRVAIFTNPVLTHSAHIDADNDGLTKAEEIAHRTVVWLADSDGDGYGDGVEVSQGYLPTVAEQRLPSGTLIQALNDPKVYLLENGAKRHIVNENVFVRRGFLWRRIQPVSVPFLQDVREGEPVI